MGAASSLVNYVVEKLREKDREIGAESVMNYAVEKWKELKEVQAKLGGNLMVKADEVFPSETRRELLQHLIQFAKPYIILVMVLFILLFCCRFCCSNEKRSEKMMKAPGRNHRMPRNAFQSNPKAYFRGLRGKQS